MSQSHTEMLRPDRYHGEPHEDNGKEGETDAFYFVLTGTSDEGGRLSGYVTREQFNWLAKQLGLRSLSDDQRVEDDYDGAPYCSSCGTKHKRFCKCEPIASNE